MDPDGDVPGARAKVLRPPHLHSHLSPIITVHGVGVSPRSSAVDRCVDAARASSFGSDAFCRWQSFGRRVVLSAAASMGWRRLASYRAASGSMYVHLANGSGDRVVVRLADHPRRPSRSVPMLLLGYPDAVTFSAVREFLNDYTDRRHRA